MISETQWLGDVTASPAPDRGGRPAKGHVGRQRKLSCLCGFGCYTSAQAVERYGFPRCACGEEMRWANIRDRLALEPEAVREELSREAFNELCREHGWSGLVEYSGEELQAQERRRHGSRAHPRKRCAGEGGYCSTFTAGRYCSEHEQRGEITSGYRRAA
jgi:hypothetical protein